MPNTKSAEQRARSSARKHLQNRSRKSQVKSLERNFLDAVATGKKDEATTAFRSVASALDKAAKRGVLHANQVSRKKSRLAVRLKGLK